MTIYNAKRINPERISGHKLVDYLITNPTATGNFKWHTLRSCMWTRLLITCPQFVEHTNFGILTASDIKRILAVQWQLITRFPEKILMPYDWITCLQTHPEIIDQCNYENFPGYVWSNILKVQPSLASHCNWEKLDHRDWSYLLRKQKQFAEHCRCWNDFTGEDWSILLLSCSDFADRCNWEKFSYWDWQRLLIKKKDFLKNLKLEFLNDVPSYSRLFRTSCFENGGLPHGSFEEPPEDPATFLICKRMDKKNGSLFLKKCYEKEDWQYIEALFDISPDEAVDIPGKKYLPFYIALIAPDHFFDKFFKTFDPVQQDWCGNSLLMPALLHDLCNDDKERKRYNFLLQKGLDPDKKNLAGFSCNEMIKYFKNKTKKGK